MKDDVRAVERRTGTHCGWVVQIDCGPLGTRRRLPAVRAHKTSDHVPFAPKPTDEMTTDEAARAGNDRDHEPLLFSRSTTAPARRKRPASRSPTRARNTSCSPTVR